MIHFVFSFSFRSTTNIFVDEIVPEIDAIDISDDESKDGDNKENVQPIKRRRSSSTGDQMKIYETLAKTLNETHSQKLNLIHQAIESTKSQSELELYFSSICKTVEKLSPIDQAQIKLQISNIVSQAELAQLRSTTSYQNTFGNGQASQPNNYYSVPSRNDYLTASTDYCPTDSSIDTLVKTSATR